MIRLVWLAPDVVRLLNNREETINLCRESVTQYMIDYAKTHDTTDEDVSRFDHNVCAVAVETIASSNPHLRHLLDARVTRHDCNPYGDVVIRFTVNMSALIRSNPGAQRLQ